MLDRLQAAPLLDEMQAEDAVHAAIPICRSSGLHHASEAIMEANRERISFIAPLRRGHCIDLEPISKNKHSKFDTSLI